MPKIVIDVTRSGDNLTITFDDDSVVNATISVVGHQPVISGLTAEQLEIFEAWMNEFGPPPPA